MRSALVVGWGRTGRAVGAALVRRGVAVTAIDDAADAATRVADAAAAGVELVVRPDAARLAALVRRADVVLPSPGVPDRHPVFAEAAASGVAVRSEFDLARQWDARPLLAVTGTNGKTTVCELVTAMLVASGRSATAVGNTDVPLVEGIDDPSVEVFVVEASSFRLGHSHRFVPRVATWLNLAPDHLDSHRDLAAYVAAKASIWADPAVALAVANADDPVVMANRNPALTTETFGSAAGADHRIVGGVVHLHGEPLVTAADLPRAHPHDLANAAAAAATAVGGGATLDGLRAALATFRPGAHRQQPVAEVGGVTFVDDSKATSPHATLAALGSFDRVVLVAGGRNKGLDLGPLGSASSVRAVVGIGEAAEEVLAAFAGRVPAARASDMDQAVRLAAGLSRPGDVVLLSPGCASFDWYGSYGERGDDFARAVRALAGEVGR